MLLPNGLYQCFAQKTLNGKVQQGKKNCICPVFTQIVDTINQNWLENQQKFGLKEIVSFLMDLHSDLSTITIKHNKYHALKVKLE